MKKTLKHFAVFMLIFLMLPLCGERAKAASTLNMAVFVSKGKTVSLAVLDKKGGLIGATWKSDKPSVAKVSATGVVRGVKSGRATITAKAKKTTRKFYIIVAPEIKTVKLNKTSLTLAGGESYTLKRTVSPNGAKGNVVWKSSKTSVASVTSKGVVKAHKAGTVTITCTVGKKSAKCKVVVKSTASYKVTGKITNAENGEPIKKAQLKFRNGYNNRTGRVVKSTRCDNQGNYSVKLATGKYTAQVSKSGFTTLYLNIMCRKKTGNSSNYESMSVTPKLETGEWRAVLTWGAYPQDLDSHLTGPNGYGGRFHVYYPTANKNAYINGRRVANLDVDDTTSYGPETVTINFNVGKSGTYNYYVHDYTNRYLSSSIYMARSNARVVVYKGNRQMAVYKVPNKPGTKWHVFKIVNGSLKKVNTMSYCSTPAMIE